MSKNKKTRPILWVMLPHCLILCASIVLYYILAKEYVIYRCEFIRTSIITCASTFSGFILTTIAILAGFINSPFIKYLRKNNGLFELRLRYSLSLLIGILSIVIAIISGFLINKKNEVSALLIVLCCGVFVSYLYSIISAGSYLLRSIWNVSNEQVSNNTSKVPKGNLRL